MTNTEREAGKVGPTVGSCGHKADYISEECWLCYHKRRKAEAEDRRLRKEAERTFLGLKKELWHKLEKAEAQVKQLEHNDNKNQEAWTARREIRDERIKELEAEVERLKESVSANAVMLEQSQCEVLDTETKLSNSRKEFTKYGAHKDGCIIHKAFSLTQDGGRRRRRIEMDTCSCGYVETKKAMEES